MKKWEPVSRSELLDIIQKSETDLSGELWSFYELISVIPEKWSESESGNSESGFWVIAVFGREVIWYNDIEEGFTISEYREHGKIESYHDEQDTLAGAVSRLYDLIKPKEL